MNIILYIYNYYSLISLIYNNIYKFIKIYYKKNLKKKKLINIIKNLKYSKIKIKEKNFKYIKNIKKNINIIGKLNYKINLFNINKLIFKKKLIIIIYINNLTNLENINNIMRICNAVNIDCVLLELTIKHKNLINNFFKISIDFIVPIIFIKNIFLYILKLKKINFKVFCLEENFNINLYEIKFNLYEKIILILGKEDKSIKKKIYKLCNYNIFIPIKGFVKNLNIYTACSICLYELIRKIYYNRNERESNP